MSDSSKSSSSKTSAGGGIWGSLIGGGASVINGLITNIFGDKNKKKELELKEQEQKYRQLLSTLDNQQKYLLQQKLDNAKTATERLKILEDSVVAIKVAKINAATQVTNKTAYFVLGSASLLIITLIIILRIDKQKN